MAQTTSVSTNSQGNIPLFPLLLVNFIGTLGYSLIIPFLVFLVTRFGGNEIMYGVIGSVYPAFQLIGAPVLGKWSDKYGRRKILFLSQLGTLIAWLFFMLALLLPVTPLVKIHSSFLGSFVFTVPLLILFFSRALDGLTGGNVSVANAYLADISTEQNRNKNFGQLSASSNLGFIIGPALAGILGTTAYKELLPVGAAILISAIALWAIIFYLPESRCLHFKKPLNGMRNAKFLGQEHKECYEIDIHETVSIIKVVNLPHIPFMLLLYFLIFLGFNIFYSAFPIHAATTLKWNVIQLGTFYSVLSLAMIYVQAFLLKVLSKRVSDVLLVLIGSIILGINFLILATGNPYLSYLAILFFALGNGVMWPSFMAILSKIPEKKYQGTVQGIASSAGSLASIIGLIIGGFLYKSFYSATFLIAAAIIFIVFVLSLRFLILDINKKK